MINFKNIRVLAACAALTLSMTALPLTALAATGSVSGSDVNVRSDANTTSSIVGTASTGDTLEIGETKTDGSGKTWYEVTLNDGTTGYIRSDFLTINEDEETSEEEVTEDTSSEDTSSEDASAEDASAEEDPNAATATEDLGGYQIVNAPDENGNATLYLYNNNAGERMKLSDIQALQERTVTAEKEAASAGTKYRVILIVLAVLLAIFVGACIVLALKLRDAVENKAERDLVAQRNRARRNGVADDDISAARRSRAGRGEAYPSGASRRERRGASDEDAREARRAARPVRAERSAAGDEDVREARRAARPVRADRSVERSAAGDEDVREARRAARPVRTDRSVERNAEDAGETRRPVRADRSVERSAEDAGETRRPVRTDRSVERSAEEEGETRRPARAERSTEEAGEATRRPARRARNVIEDDDFDYGFISMDDK